jgi:deoxycytidylate deaminase
MTDLEELRHLAGCTCPPGSRDSTAAKIVCNKCGAQVIARPQVVREELARDHVVQKGVNGAGPPLFSIAAAESAAALSPCQKSKRGAVFYRTLETDSNSELGLVIEYVEQTFAQGWNGPPWIWDGDEPLSELACDGTEACRRDCAKRCVHAEQRAILALISTLKESPSALRMVHVKIGDDGRAVPGKRPCCAECSKLILDSGIGGIWLYESAAGTWVKNGRLSDESPGVWRYYAAQEFHETTMTNLGIYQVRSRT